MSILLSNVTKKFPVYDENLSNDEQVRDGFFYALSDVSLSIDTGGCTIIGGANGSGKSLLMSIIAGLEEPTSGAVKTDVRVGLVFQEPDAQILGETVQEDVTFGPANMRLSKEQINIQVNDALTQTGLCKRKFFPARSLSGGEKRRLAAAGVLAMNAEIIIFDEPYANMDYTGIVQVNRLFKKLITDGRTVIILTHELEKCMALANRFIILFKGKIVFDGQASDALSVDLESFGIHHPLRKAALKLEDLLW